MKPLVVIALLLLLGASVTPAQDDAVTFDEVMESAEQWAKENLDEEALRVLQSGDQRRVKQLFADLQKEFQGEYVLDLAAFKEAARAMVPLLEGYEETAPYAAWLKTRLDYLDVADQLRRTLPPPKPEPGKGPKRIPNPPAQKERELWIRKLADRPRPDSAKPYVPRLKPIFIEQHVPGELVWLAEVESSFDPRARSPVGAAGLFQLTPATAKRYGLRTWPLDQRLKPEPSARVAARYLDFLHSHFKDWRLALAAYNAGEGSVDKLLARHQARSYDAIATHLPAETQMYVPRVEATLLRREGVKLDQLRAPRAK